MNRKSRMGLVVAVAMIAVAGSQLIAGPKPVKPKKEADKPAEKPAQAYTPVLNIEQTMEGQGALMKSIKNGIIDGAWSEAEKSALILAEVSNTNQYHKDAKDYQDWAKDLSKTALDLAGSLKKRDEAESKTLMQKAGATCKACHEVYKKKW
ncbi:MAG TPA: cytochrome c [Phycisphaerae bacterium]|nr:cytochrome c [Phycisphaerae bacterium]HRW55206.1 cytochrome c [Phycisphaerae bacterium]